MRPESPPSTPSPRAGLSPAALSLRDAATLFTRTGGVPVTVDRLEVLHQQFPPDVYLEGSTTRQTTLSREHQGPCAVLNALERLAGAYGSECVRVRQDLSIAETQLRDYQARLGK